MGQPSNDDLADLLYAPDDVSPGNRGDDLLSQLAGESIDRMMCGEFEPIVNPVEKLTNQLDTFFEELQHRRQMKSVPPQAIAAAAPAGAAPAIDTTAPREEQIEIMVEQRDALEAPDTGVMNLGVELAAPARAMLVGLDETDEEPAYLKPIDWLAGPIEAMSNAGRVVMSLTAVASFLAACGTLAWVLVLRQAQ